jgi:hypothetical protein
MRLQRKEDISMYLYIKDVVVGPRYSEICTGMSLSSAGTNLWNMEYDENLEKHPFRRLEKDINGLGRGLLYFDYTGETCLFGIEQSDIVKVYNGATMASGGYKVNYLNGQIESSQDLSSYVVDYEWNYVSVLDAWPWDEVPSLPIITIERDDGDSKGLQLGGGDIREGNWTIEIFGNNNGERDDLLDVIWENIYMRRCPLLNLDKGLPLHYSGLFNNSFNPGPEPVYSSLYFDNAKKRLTGLPKWGFYDHELINRYRAQITFTTRNYKN